ncbi:hypothetical protein [Lactococcus petauri]|nr:hypothetical protein [Lactococcus petauri]
MTQYGAETNTFDSVKGFEYGYRVGNEGTSGEGKVQIIRNSEAPKNRVFSQGTKNFQDGVDTLIATRNGFAGYGIGMAIAMAGLIVAQFVPVVNVVVDAITGVLGGSLGPGGATALALLIINYANASSSTARSFNAL